MAVEVAADAALQAAALKTIGAGLAACGMIGAGVGLGFVFGKYFEAIARQPGAKKDLQLFMFIGMGMVEAIALFAFVIAMMVLFS